MVTRLNALSDLKLGRARNVQTWEEVLALYPKCEWVMVPTGSMGRMAYAALTGNRYTGQVMALVMLEGGKTPEVFFPSGSVLFTIRGTLRIMESGHWLDLEAWDLIQMEYPHYQEPQATGLYLGLWAFPFGNPLLQMMRQGEDR